MHFTVCDVVLCCDSPAGAVLCDDSDSDGDSVIILNAIELVAEHLLEPVLIDDSEPG